jgi:hypothetical protein
MRSFESKTHSFIVKLWLEETADESERPKWRGHITHVPDGARRYLDSVHGIPAFISSYLDSTGVKVRMFGRLRQWLNR